MSVWGCRIQSCLLGCQVYSPECHGKVQRPSARKTLLGKNSLVSDSHWSLPESILARHVCLRLQPSSFGTVGQRPFSKKKMMTY